MFKFFKDHALITWALVLGPCITVATKLNDAYTLYNLGLPRLVWEAIGMALFFGAVIVLLFRFNKEQQDRERSESPETATTPRPASDKEPPPATVRHAENKIELKRSYFGPSKDLFDENLTTISRILNGRGLEAVKIADRFLPNFVPSPVGFRAQRYEPFKSEPQKAAAILSEIRTTIWGSILREHRDQAADLTDILQSEQPIMDFENSLNRTMQYFSSFRVIYEKNDEQSSDNAALLFSLLKEPTLKDVAAFNGWIEECNRRIESKRKALGS